MLAVSTMDPEVQGIFFRLGGGELTTTGAMLAVNAALQAADLAADHPPIGVAEAVST